MYNALGERIATVLCLVVLVTAPSTAVAATGAAPGPASTGWGAVDGSAGGEARVAAGVPADVASTVRTPGGDTINVTQSYERANDDGYLLVTVEVDASAVTDRSNYGGFVVALPDEASVITTANLSTSMFRGYEFQADGDAATASLKYRVPAQQRSTCSDDPSAYTSTDEGAWAFTSRYSTGASVVLLYQGRVPPDVAVEHDLVAEGSGVGGSGFAYMGAYETYERSFDGQNVTLVVPNAARDRVNVTAVFGALTSASATFDVGKRSDRVVLFAAPDPIRQGGAAVGTWNEDRMDAWVSADAPLEEAGNAWLHEYVHTRQAYGADYHLDGAGTNTSFLVEGGADYYASLLSLRAGNASFDEFYADVNASYGADAVLGDQPVFGCGGLASYSKGRRVVAALDAKIRNDTDGERSFADVYERMNADADGRVTFAEFKEYVAATAGVSYDAWLEKYVQTAAVPSVPEDPFAFARADVDEDGDGLTTAEERALGTDPFRADTDGDGLDDGREVEVFGSNATVTDSDGDGVPDGIEVEHGMDPASVHSDEDGIPDSVEWQRESLNASATDTDGDGLADDRERELGTKPDVADTDGDGMEDGAEVEAGADPLVEDTDDDGLVDGDEVAEGTDPTVADTDGDGIEDGDEVYEYDTDPTAKDTDGDGVTDGREIIQADTDPTDPDDYPTGTTAASDGGDGGDGSASTAAATTAGDGDASGGDGTGGDGVVGPDTVPGFGAPAALLALVAACLIAVRARD